MHRTDHNLDCVTHGAVAVNLRSQCMIVWVLLVEVTRSLHLQTAHVATTGVAIATAHRKPVIINEVQR